MVYLVLHPPTCDVNFQTPEAQDAVPDIVEVKCPYSAAHLTIYEAVHSLKDFYLGKYMYIPMYINLNS